MICSRILKDQGRRVCLIFSENKSGVVTAGLPDFMIHMGTVGMRLEKGSPPGSSIWSIFSYM